MYRVIKPIKQPPKLDEYEDLSEEAQKTIKALKKKYTLRINEISNRPTCCDLRPTIPLKGTEKYYKYVYDASFKREYLTPIKDPDSSTSVRYGHSEHSKPIRFDSNRIQRNKVSIVPVTQGLYDDLNIVKRKMGERKISECERGVDEKLRVEVNSPCLDLSPSTYFDTEEVVCYTPLPPVLSESPIRLVPQGSKVLPQKSPEDKLYGQMGEKIVVHGKKSSSSYTHKEDSLQSLLDSGQFCSPLLYDERPIPSKAAIVESSASEQGLKASSQNASSPQEAQFDLKLSGLSPLVGNNVDNLPTAMESPFGLSQRSFQGKDGNSMDVQECPFSHKRSEPLSEKCHSQALQRVLEIKPATFKNKRKRKAEPAAGTGNVKESPRKTSADNGNCEFSLKQNSRSLLPKRMKSKFFPPTKISASLTHNIDEGGLNSSKEDREGTLPFAVQFFSLNNQEQKKARSFIESSNCLCLTVLYTNGEASLNTFYTAADHAKKKSIVCKSIDGSITFKSVKILTPNNVCYELTISPQTVETTRHILSSLLNDAKCEKVIVNLKDFLIFMFKGLKCDIKQEIRCKEIHDPVIASWLLNPDVQPSSFKHLCQTARFSVNSNEWLSCLSKVQKLMIALKDQLVTEKLWNLYTKIEMRLVPIIACMECCNLKVDMKTFIQFSDIIKSKLYKLEEKAYDLVGHKFSINSHPQLRHVLYEELKLDKKIPSKSKIGKTNVAHQKSTSESALNLMKDVHPLPQIMLEYRSLQKMVSTYVEGLMTCVADGYLSTHWDQTAAATGRLTSSQPNIQTVPKAPMLIEDYKTNFIAGLESTASAELYAREPFVSRDGHTFLAADFQQIELRIFAHLSHDKTLLSLFWKPDSGDIFNLLTSEWHGKSVDLVTSQDREQTKRVVYSVLYGVGKEKLSEYLKIPPESARDIMHSFLVRFPCINAFSKKCTAFAEVHGFTETICGRKRHFPNIRSNSPVLKAQAERQAINFCVQGSAADICKQAMIKVEAKLSEHTKLQCRLLLQIHDELVWEVSEDQVFEVKEIIKGVMENPKALCSEFCDLQVPLTVSFTYGKSWAHLTQITHEET